tara:strand:- start:420 stop:617 length:198 start_codon:yes stop_codon:yes gene_type:complete
LTDFAGLKKSASWPGAVAETVAPRLVPYQDPTAPRLVPYQDPVEHWAVRVEAPVVEVTYQGPDIG